MLSCRRHASEWVVATASFTLVWLGPTTIGFAEGTYFEDVTSAVGVSAPHSFLTFGTGQAWGDYDRDGCPDLYVTDLAGPNSLFRNDCSGAFQPSPVQADVVLSESLSAGAVWADFDNDGWLDLFVANDGSDSLFRNLGGAGFSEVSGQAGVAGEGQGQSAAWADFDQDGWLDLYVAVYDGTDSLYRNQGDGTFAEVSSWLPGQESRPTFACAFLDFDNDGDQDLYAVNDRLFGNYLWRNDGPGCSGWCFTDVSGATGADRPVYGMGIAIGDYDGDLDLDLYFSSIAEQVLLQNQTAQGTPMFIEVSEAAGVAADTAGWGTVFFDYDNDGWLDLYLAGMPTSGTQLTDRLYRNLRDGTFEDVSDDSGASGPGASLGVAASDFDRDGQVDLVVSRFDDSYRVFRNAMTSAGASVLFTLEGAGQVSRDAVGTRLYLDTDDGRTQMRELKAGSSFGSGNEMALHFGLGDAEAESLRVVWPDGLTEVIDPLPSGPVRHLRHPHVFADGFESGDLLAWSSVVP